MASLDRSDSFERVLSWSAVPLRQAAKTHSVYNERPIRDTILLQPIVAPGVSQIEAESTSKIPSFRQRLVARWRVNKSDWIFTAFVVILQISFGAWQCYKYASSPAIRSAFGWGVGLAKLSAGALYPTMFFLILSMSRWTVTLLRNLTYMCSAINFDKFRSFHIRMAICAFLLSWLHTVGHLSGTFVHGSDTKYSVAVAELLSDKFETVSYAVFIYSLPGWTGIVALVNFTLIVICATPPARRWCFELFQYSHLLIYPMIGLLMFHGAGNMLQYPALGLVMAFPTGLVLLEKLSRLLRMLHGQIAHVQPANNDVMHLSFPQTKASRWWGYKVGQYVIVRMPTISAFECHPFTISRCRDGQFQLYVKKSGDWTKELARLKGPQIVNVDGPFGAPAQQFYQYDHCIVIATGIGVTPCSAILDDMYRDIEHPWAIDPTYHRDTNRVPNSGAGIDISSSYRISRKRVLPRFVDFYWAVPNQGMLPWFAETFSSTATAPHNRNVGIRLQIYITRMKQEDFISKEKLTSMFSHDIDAQLHPGRPDYSQLMFEHYEKMRFMQSIYRMGASEKKGRKKIGVFFCGAKAARDQLRALCLENTIRGVTDGSGFEYHFHPEVF